MSLSEQDNSGTSAESQAALAALAPSQTEPPPVHSESKNTTDQNVAKTVKPTWRHRIDSLKAWLQSELESLPVFGTCFKCSRKDFYGALTEFLHLVLWSTMPFWLGGLVLFAIDQNHQMSLWARIVSTFKNGELLVFVISTVAPTLFLALHEPEGAKAFPHRLPLSTIVSGIIIICAVMFSLQKAVNERVDATFIFTLSVILAVVALGIRYLALIYHRFRLPAMTGSDLRKPQDGFLEEFDEHRKNIDG